LIPDRRQFRVSLLERARAAAPDRASNIATGALLVKAGHALSQLDVRLIKDVPAVLTSAAIPAAPSPGQAGRHNAAVI
jgi:hypothetical protein